MDMKDWVHAARTHKKWTQRQLADAVNRTKGAVGHWETGKHAPSVEMAEHISTLTGYPLPHMGAGEPDENFVQVRRTDVKFSNGVGRLVFAENDGEPLMFRADFLRRMGIKPSNAVVVRAAGISNEPKITDDAVVLVNRGDRDNLDGGFFAFRVDGELLIKRLERLEGVGVLAVAENPNFKPKTRIYNGAVDFEVIGRAVWMGTLL